VCRIAKGEIDHMRILLKASLDTAASNRHIQNGTLGPLMKSVMDELKPEAAYFTLENGKRAAYVFMNIEDASEIPRICEPFLLALEAEVEVTPAMNSDDIRKAMPSIESAAKKYGAK
jgi:hypothetical protein